VAQGLTLAHFRAQLEDLREHIAHVRARLEHLRDTSTDQFGSDGGQSNLMLSGKGQGELKLSGIGNECKALPWRRWWPGRAPPPRHPPPRSPPRVPLYSAWQTLLAMS